MGVKQRVLEWAADAKRGMVTGAVNLETGHRIAYVARGLHVDRFNKQKATVEIRFQTADVDDYLSYDDIDIRDREERNRLANAARKHLEGPKGEVSLFALDIGDWTESVNQHLMDKFCLEFPLKLFEAQGAKWGSAGDTITVEDMHIADFLHRFGGHLLYGPKGSGKTELAVILSRCLQFKMPLFGEVRQTAKVMFLQLERSEQSFLKAVQLVNRALGLPIDEPILYRVERGRSLAGMIDAIAADVDKYNVDVLITDSISRMSEGGSLKDDNTANPIMDRLNSVAPSHFDLAHTSWDGKGDPEKAHVFGSVHFGNASDVVHQIVRQWQDKRVAGVMVHTRDANAFSPGGKLYFRAEYDELGLLRFERAQAEAFPELGQATGLLPAERNEIVWRALPHSKTIEELIEDTGLAKEEVEATLRSSKDKSFVQTGEKPSTRKGGRPAKTWGRKYRDEYGESSDG